MPIPFLIAAGVAAAAGLGSAVAGGVGSANAARAQETQAQKAMRLQQQMWRDQQGRMSPYLEAGRTTLAQLLEQMNGGAFDRKFDPSQLASDPGYQFRMAEGQKALERSAASKGGLMSGGFAKGLTQYGQGFASNEFQNAWQRDQAEKTGQFSRLSGIADMGERAAGAMGQMGQQYANQMSNLYGDVGNAQSAGAIGTANAVSGGFNTLGNLAMMAGMSGAGGGGGGGSSSSQFIPPQQQYTQPWNGVGRPSYGQSTQGYQTQGYGPWR